MNANSGSDNDESLFGSTSAPPEKKRRKLNDDSEISYPSATSTEPKASNSSAVDPVLLEHAKSRLSKFAARLFDPNRIKVRLDLNQSLNFGYYNDANEYTKARKQKKCLTSFLYSFAL